MNPRLLLVTPLVMATPGLLAQAGSYAGANAPTPPPLVQAGPRAVNPVPQPGQNQRVYGPGPSAGTLVAREAADGVLEGFKKVYLKDGAPRVVIYVNRALIDPGAKPVSENVNAASLAPTLADQQTVRDIERYFGRAFRQAGAQLADQKIAASLLPDQAGERLLGDHAAKDRAALATVADIAIEVLISNRNLAVSQMSGDASLVVPDIQATAIRLKDSAIVGQASASDIIGKGARAGQIARQFDLGDIAEATALALMEDMLVGKK